MALYTQDPSTQEADAEGLGILMHSETLTNKQTNKSKWQLRMPGQGDHFELSLMISGHHL